MASRSPVSGTPLGKGSSAPETPMSATASTSPRAVPFPPPQTFDFLPQLHALLQRLLAAQVNTDTSGAGAGGGGDVSGVAGQTGPGPSSSGPGQSQQQQPSNLGGAGTNNSSDGSSQRHAAGISVGGSATSITLGPNVPPPLDVKDLPTEASAIKIRIQKARAVVDALPDVDRTVEDQSREIEELEDRITRLRKVIGEFGRRADGEKTEDTKMVT